MNKFKQLQTGEAEWSSTVREYLREMERPNECIYCGAKDSLTVEHILPRARGGPDSPDNVVKVCKTCNSSKGAKRLYEWLGLENKDTAHRVAEGKYLKLLYSLHEKNKTLDRGVLCSDCDLSSKCPEKEKLTVYCLEGCFRRI